MKNIKIREYISTEKLRQVSSNVSSMKGQLERVRYNLESVEGSYSLQGDLRESERLFEALEHRVNQLGRLKAKTVQDLYQLDQNLARQQEAKWHQKVETQHLDKYRSHNNHSRLDWILSTKGQWIKRIASILGVTASQAVLGLGAGRYMPEKVMDLGHVSQWIGHPLNSQFEVVRQLYRKPFIY